MIRQVAASLLLIASTAFGAEQTFLSKVYTIDKKYRSMEGPSSVETVYLGDRSKPELLWITGIRTEMVTEDGTTPQLPELMCHVNVDLDANKHQALFDLPRPVASRLMTLSQGMLDSKLPPGFGFPIASDEPLLLFTQVLNLNIEHPNNLKVRHRVTFTYVRDADLKEPMHALFNLGASGMVQLNNNPLAMTTMMDTSEHHGASCLIGQRAPQAAASSADYVDPDGRHMTGHWIVPPGRQTNASDITWFLRLPFDTKLHYVAVHLHPFAESLSVRDVTTGQTVFLSHAQNPAKGIGLTHVDTISSVPGIPFYKDHKYELVSVYNNTTTQNADSMASVFLGLDDPDFAKPHDLAKRAAALFDSDRVTVHTTAGDFTALLARDAAPSTSLQFARLALSGVFNRAATRNSGSEVRLTVKGSESTRRLLEPLGDDRGLPLQAGTVAYCSPTVATNEITIRFILAGTPAADDRCIGFAHIGDGESVLRAIHEAPAGSSAFVSSLETSR
ncbi:MAG TPA: peptidylprolyl isomerase [Thermoanaerobaculia bacterium]|nr:peptidylprolyl isomerase [Thermoanaerobaculia bacterium]